MIIQVEVSVYPLETDALRETIDTFINRVSQHGLNVNKGAMSTILSGDDSVMFTALNAAFVQIANDNKVVMVLKISNACPSCDAASPETNTHHSTK
ncbi:MAG: thiamine-binding protein [Gammaproteobacteria bacterium]|nr:thiamine-binding protein [Gammaproteobacteria bacterium]